MAATCLVGLGSNLGARQAVLEQALALLAQLPDVEVVARSAWRETRPVGGPPAQPPYLNGAALLSTTCDPQGMLARLQDVERRSGRARAVRWGPRSVDLDLLLYDRIAISSPTLSVPHPRMAWRRFVLEPAAEIAADMVHPTTGWSVGRLLAHLNTAKPYVAIAGPIAAGKTELAQAVAARLDARWTAEQINVDLLSAFYADPVERAWRTELAWLEQRARQLARSDPRWESAEKRPVRWTVSDFWFDQSAAFADVWLPESRREEFRQLWRAARATVLPPKLTVLLDVPAATLHQRMRARGRPYEQGLTVEQLERIRAAILAQASAPDLGPVLRLTSAQEGECVEETLAALQAME